jgi:hypothetical protein
MELESTMKSTLFDRSKEKNHNARTSSRPKPCSFIARRSGARPLYFAFFSFATVLTF